MLLLMLDLSVLIAWLGRSCEMFACARACDCALQARICSRPRFADQRLSGRVQYEDLTTLLPHLRPRIQPRSLLDSDLAAIIAGTEAGAQHDLQQRLRELEEAATECSVCGGREAHADGLSDDLGASTAAATKDASGRRGRQTQDGNHLALTSVWRLNFKDRLCELQPPAVCCRMCRACFDIGGVLQLSALRSGAADGQRGCVRSAASWFRLCSFHIWGCVLA